MLLLTHPIPIYMLALPVSYCYYHCREEKLRHLPEISKLVTDRLWGQGYVNLHRCQYYLHVCNL